MTGQQARAALAPWGNALADFRRPRSGQRPFAPLTAAERALVGLELFLAGGAFVGGGGMLLDPSGKGQGFPPDLLQGTPFGSYLIPGIILLLVNGLVPSMVVVLTILRRPRARWAHMVVALALAGWLAGETFLIGLASWMQPFFFAYALVVAALAVLVRGRRDADRTRARP